MWIAVIGIKNANFEGNSHSLFHHSFVFLLVPFTPKVYPFLRNTSKNRLVIKKTLGDMLN